MAGRSRSEAEVAHHGDHPCRPPGIRHGDSGSGGGGSPLSSRVCRGATCSRAGAQPAREGHKKGRGKVLGVGVEPRGRSRGRIGSTASEASGTGAATRSRPDKGQGEEGEEELPISTQEENKEKEEEERPRVEQDQHSRGRGGRREENQEKTEVGRPQRGQEEPSLHIWGHGAGPPIQGASQGYAICPQEAQEEGVHFIEQWNNNVQPGRQKLRGRRGPSPRLQQDPQSSQVWSRAAHGHGNWKNEGIHCRAGGLVESGGVFASPNCHEICSEHPARPSIRRCTSRSDDVGYDVGPADDGQGERISRPSNATLKEHRKGGARKLMDIDGKARADWDLQPPDLDQGRVECGGQGGAAGQSSQGSSNVLQRQGSRSSRRKRKEREERGQRQRQEIRRRRSRTKGKERQVKEAGRGEKRGAECSRPEEGATGSGMLERDFKQEKDQRLAKDPQRVIAPERGAGSQELPRAFCPRLERAATRVEANLVQIAETVSSAEKNDEVRFSQGGGFPEVVRWLDSRLDTFFLVRCRAKPTGRVFPLPTSDLAFKVTFPEEPPETLCCLRLVCVSLNSLNGEGLYCDEKASALQVKILFHLLENCRRVLEWVQHEKPASWESFFRVKTIDYRGEEIQTAQSVQWENIAPALPDEVGSVDLAEVVEQGSRHYVLNFSEYLIPEEDQVYTRPPKVHVPPEAWSTVCEGLIRKGICRVIHESEVYRVRGELLLNGLFGVSKHEHCNGFETRRLIMNMVPLNKICRGIAGDVSTLPSWANMSALHLMPHEDLLVSSEDVRCFFYIFRVPREWHGFLAFNRPVPPHLKGPLDGSYYLCSSVLPIGFKNSVSLAQHVHRVVVRRSLLRRVDCLGSEAEIRKDRPFPACDHLFRVYLDNFDELKKVNKVLAETIEGKVSPLSMGLRDEYVRLQIPRHPKKSAQQLRTAEVQGAIIDGSRGVAYPKPDKVMKYCQLACHLLAAGRCTQRQAQVIGGGFVYLAMFRRPLLGGLNALWKFIVELGHFPPVVALEIVRCLWWISAKTCLRA